MVISHKSAITMVVILFVLLNLLFFSGCREYAPVSKSKESNENRVPAGIGLSGMAQMDDGAYLVVHDTKAHKDGPRLGIVSVQNDRDITYRNIPINDWNHPDGRSSDLESVCSIPGRNNEFLAAESGDWAGRSGRILHIVLSGSDDSTSADVLCALQLPILAENRKGWEGDNYEGVACAETADGNVLVILGERGGSQSHPQGVIRWALYLPKECKLARSQLGDKGKIISAPGPWIDESKKRDIADLYLDQSGNLWAVATEDPGDIGPFRSVIYKVAVVNPDSQDPIRILKEVEPAWILDGLKIEAIGAPPSMIPNSILSFGSEDEVYGGIWRPLFPPVKHD